MAAACTQKKYEHGGIWPRFPNGAKLGSMAAAGTKKKYEHGGIWPRFRDGAKNGVQNWG